jgi:hypothetical protein
VYVKLVALRFVDQVSMPCSSRCLVDRRVCSMSSLNLRSETVRTNSLRMHISHCCPSSSVEPKRKFSNKCPSRITTGKIGKPQRKGASSSSQSFVCTYFHISLALFLALASFIVNPADGSASPCTALTQQLGQIAYNDEKSAHLFNESSSSPFLPSSLHFHPTGVPSSLRSFLPAASFSIQYVEFTGLNKDPRV